MLANDLIFHSVLEFNFKNNSKSKESTERGWGECLILGDTQTGKTKIAEKLIRHYKLGRMCGTENSTIPGLIGGMSKIEGSNFMTWGLLPINNSRLVVLDEMSGLDQKVIGSLTRIRDSGEASRTVVGSSRVTTCKVRIIWISNPRGKRLKDYDYGCDAVTVLVGEDEDISRFDFILTVTDEEVSIDDINKGTCEEVHHVYTSDMCHKLVLWAWSRKPDQIKFTDKARALILSESKKMVNQYSSKFPLVLRGTMRLKLAKLSIALACRLFSTKDGVNVIVTEEHITFIRTWLDMIYNKPAMGYGDYSRFHGQTIGEDSTSTERARTIIEKTCLSEKKEFMRHMLAQKQFTVFDIQDLAKCDKYRSDDLRQELLGCGFLEVNKGTFKKTHSFTNFLKKELKK